MKLEGRIIDAAIQLKKFLGCGAAGDVYSAITLKPIDNIQQGSSVAVKIYKPQILNFLNQRQRIEREFHVGYSQSHPNLMKTYHLGFDDINGEISPYLLMELLEGMTLREYVKMHYPLSENQIISLFQQLCSADLCLHKAGLVHRDIKPENIMILNNGKLKLMDLGVLQDPKDTPLTASDQFLGTIRYAAPEYLFKLNASEKSDAYSVGAVLYFMIYGQDIFSKEKLFSNVIRLIDSMEIEITAPNRPASKRICLLLEITRRLLLQDTKERLSLKSAILEIISGPEGELWNGYIIPLIRYRAACIWQWERIPFPESNPKDFIFTSIKFLPEEFYSTLINDLPDEEWTKIYVNENVEEVIAKIESLKQIVNIKAVNFNLADWKECFLNAKSTRTKIGLLRSILCKYYRYHNLDELLEIIDWVRTINSNNEIVKFCNECDSWLYGFEALHESG